MVMEAVAKFPINVLEALSDIVSDQATNADIDRWFHQLEIEPRGAYVKSKRISYSLYDAQEEDGNGRRVVTFIEESAHPVRFVGRKAEFGRFQRLMSEALAYCGLRLGDDGMVAPAEPARTIHEAQDRMVRLLVELQRRGVHPEVLKYCRDELVAGDPYHAMLEATKGVAERIRQMTGLTNDGDDLVTDSFAVGDPMLTINEFRTESDKSEHKGYGNLLRGAMGHVRNPKAHDPRLTSPNVEEQDMLDWFTLLSYLHRRLDTATVLRRAAD